jgi:DNA-binding response OmpR family regulator
MMHRDPSTRRHLVLLVEDNADAREIYTKTLAHEGFEVIAAKSVGEAHEASQRRRPDVVVLDCRLPDGDGLELAQAWRQCEDMQTVPIVVLTAFSARQDVEAALLAGADAFVVKPCTGAVLAKQILRVLDGKRPSHLLRSPV